MDICGPDCFLVIEFSVIVSLAFQKVKEVTYMHSEGIMAGELKHGPLALIDEKMPILMIITRDPVHDKCMNALHQVRRVSR